MKIFFLFFTLLMGSQMQAVNIEIQQNGKCYIEGKAYPGVGFGTFPLKDETCFKAVTQAAQKGYRILDTATFYGNFEPISQALKNFGRENFYIISKVWPNSQTAEGVRHDFKTTLEKLGTEYLDAYLVHWPTSHIPIEETLFAMDGFRKKGALRHIGLSNITVAHLERALEVGVPISWVQVEMHPDFYDPELLKFCQRHSIAVQAWGPLGRGHLSEDPMLKKIGAKYGKTPSQVALRWIIQWGCLPIPGSKKGAHIAENFEIEDFSLSQTEMEQLNARAKRGNRERVRIEDGMGFADEFDFTYEECWPHKIRIVTLQSSEIIPHLKEIVQFVNQIYSASPYFYNGEDSGYTSYLESYPFLDVTLSLAFSGDEIVGIAAGLPMPSRDVYQEPLCAHGYTLETLFYLGEFGVKPEYQGRGIEERLYRSIEEIAEKTGQFEAICCWEIESELKGWVPSDDFWQERGFVCHPELNFTISWTHTGESEESLHQAVYWVKYFN